MAAWSKSEKDGFQDLLESLPSDVIDSVFETSTQGKVEEHSKQGKIKAILSFSESAESLFKRKRITKDFLLNYAYRKGIPVTSAMKQQELQDSITHYWWRKTKSVQKVVKTDDIQTVKQQHTVRVPPPPVVYNIYNQTQINQFTVNVTAPKEVEDNSDFRMAVRFVEWYYKMLNSLHETSAKRSDFGPSHFWDNSEIHMSVVSNGQEENTYAIGSQKVVEKIALLVKSEALLFNPNTTKEGIRIRSDPHGLKLILACGSLHKDNNCVGVFQQSFGLVKTPETTDVWKIKISLLKMKAEPVQSPPSLLMAGDAQTIEGLTIKALENSVKR